MDYLPQSPLSISRPLYTYILSVLEKNDEEQEEKRVRISSPPPISPHLDDTESEIQVNQSATSSPAINFPSSRSPSPPFPFSSPSSSSSLSLSQHHIPLYSETGLEILARRVSDLKNNRANLIYSAETYEKIIAKKFERNGPLWSVPAYNKFISEVEKHRMETRRSLEEVKKELNILETQIEIMSPFNSGTETKSEEIANFIQEYEEVRSIFLRDAIDENWTVRI